MSSHTLNGRFCAIPILLSGLAIVAAIVPGTEIVSGQTPQGAIVGWGRQVVGVDLSQGFIQVAAGDTLVRC